MAAFDAAAFFTSAFSTEAFDLNAGSVRRRRGHQRRFVEKDNQLIEVFTDAQAAELLKQPTEPVEKKRKTILRMTPEVTALINKLKGKK